jgi:phosphoglycerate dehydrogenase-like enzyme
MQITFLVKLNDYWIESINSLKKEFPSTKFISHEETQNPEEYINSSDGIVLARARAFNIEEADKLKILFIPWTGVDFLPWEIIKSRNIMVANTHGNAKAVAERAISLCLALLGRVVEFHNDLRNGQWHGFSRGSAKEDFWTSIQGKLCTILGLGTIGIELSKLLKPFGCKIIGYKKNITTKPDSVDEITNDLSKAITEGEIIFVILPLTSETNGLLNWEILSKMKDKYLFNFSRGELIDEESLYKALKEGILKGAAIDTWYQYPKKPDEITYPSKYPIYDFKNVVISPHVGGFSKESQKEMIIETIDNIRSFLKTGKPISQVSPEAEY